MQGVVVQLLLHTGKQQEALDAARDFLKLEPNNPPLRSLVDQMEKSQPGPSSISVKDIFDKIAALIQANQTNEAAGLLDTLAHNPQVNGDILTQIANHYSVMRNLPKAEEAMLIATKVEPNASLSWYNLANIQAYQGRAADAAQSLKKAFAANDLERILQPRMMNLRDLTRTNPYFNAIRQTPEFRAALGTN